jgi:hypothetical protein
MRRRQTYDSWFGTKIREALMDDRPDIPSEVVEAEFAERRATSTIRRRNRT